MATHRDDVAQQLGPVMDRARAKGIDIGTVIVEVAGAELDVGGMGDIDWAQVRDLLLERLGKAS